MFCRISNCIVSIATLAFVFLLPVGASAEIRHWEDASGLYSVDADFVTSDDKLVVLAKEDGELVVLRRDELSTADREFLTELLARRTKAAESSELAGEGISRWKLLDGSIIQGELVGFGDQKLIVKRERGDLYVNEYKLDALPMAYEKVVPHVVSAIDGKPLENLNELEKHLADGGGGPFEYDIEGVQLKLAEGGAITIPLPLLASEEAKAIMPGFTRWKAARAEEVAEEDRYEAETRERLALDSYQRLRQRESIRDRQFKMMELGLLQVGTGIVDVWEVALFPNNAYGYPRSVVVSARDSLAAQQMAHQRYPRWRVGAVRKLSR
ncbi:SHD1 domain-containing protein [Stieleria varia]|uniref:SLA1 homology domain-containing protein n=1 Tax=Stieleria varia TaxID=2528005 RepID=A0A5C6AFG1_9BACT|nr:SHD1 domain-containing protein [Stieleria varia]TWT98349.1 hypothetical protein Pla52n_48610 [Stieleria varia]